MEPTSTTDRTARVDWGAVAVGAAAGLVVLVGAAALHAVLQREVTDFEHTGWVVPPFVLVLVGYGLAGWVAERRERLGTPLTHGALAALGALVLWVPLRVVIWAVRGEDRGLVRGSDAALRPGQVFANLVVAAAIGMLAALAARYFAPHDSAGAP